ncbi:MAG: PKD domain-containing protein [Flavobacteriales bacterium]|nr:PKD domain-containing protein [Flavobacteriales bacterium]
MLIATFNNVQAQDVIPSSADIRLVQGTAGDQLLVQMKIHSTSDFGGILSALTVTIRYDASSGMAIGGGTSFCSAWSAFSPSPVVLNGGLAYRTYNGFGINRLEDPVFDGGCGISLVPEEWFTITTIPVAGEGCTEFILGNDAFTQLSNRNYYVSMGGHNVTGQVLDGPVNGGNCAPDCLGIPGGTALPGTPCDDLDPGTFDDTWGANCVCTGTTGCVPPTITGTSTNSPICSSNGLNLAVTATGSGPLSYAWTGAGSYSPNPTSASVTVTGAATGPYQVTVSNTCGDASASIPVMVQQAPSATIAYGGSPYCATTGTATVTRTGTSGGTYTASPGGLSITGSTGTINLGNSTAGTYTVTYTIAAGGGCAAFSTTATVVARCSWSFGYDQLCGNTGLRYHRHGHCHADRHFRRHVHGEPERPFHQREQRNDQLGEQHGRHVHGDLHHCGGRRLRGLQHHGHGCDHSWSFGYDQLCGNTVLRYHRHGHCHADRHFRRHVHGEPERPFHQREQRNDQSGEQRGRDVHGGVRHCGRRRLLSLQHHGRSGDQRSGHLVCGRG